MGHVLRELTIEFAAQSGPRFEQLRTVFSTLKLAKATDTFDDEDPNWLNHFDDDAKRYFRWLDSDPGKPAGVCGGPSGWDFWSMIHALYNGEYDLIACEMVSTDKAKLRFGAHAYPFGGTESLRVLIECFGFLPLRNWDDKPFPTWEEIEEAYRRMGK